MKKSCIEALYPNCSDHIFYNEASLSECYQHFKAVSAQFDAVICTNDIVAASLLFHLREDHISVPEQLFITCLGNSTLAAKIKPGITTVSLDHFEMGRQAIKLYAWLSRQEQQTCVSVRIRAQLTVRNSTAMIPASKVTTASLPSQKSVDFYSDPEAQKLFAAEQLLSTATETDFLIMQGLLTGLNQEELQDRLFLSDSSLRYHIRYLMKSAGVKNRHEFLAFLQTWQELLYYK